MKKIKSKLYARHGDVFIFKVNSKIPFKNYKKQKTLTLALGEVTGHSHKLSSNGEDILVEENFGEDSHLFEIFSESILTHEEHEPIVLKPGKYMSIIQMEYDPIEHRKKVID